MMLALCVHVCVCARVCICLWAVRVCLYMCMICLSLSVHVCVCLSLCVCVCACFYACVCMYVYVFMICHFLWVSVCVCVHMCVGTQACIFIHRPEETSGVLVNHSLLSPLFECLSLNVESQCAPLTLLSLPPKSWGYRHMPSYAKLFMWMWGFEHSAHSFLLSYHPSSSCELFHEQSLGKNIWIPCYSK